MKRLIPDIKELRFILLLSVVAIISHRAWFTFGTVLNNGDWQFWADPAVKELYYSYTPWLTSADFGGPNVQIYFYFFKVVWSAIVHLGGSYDTAVKLTFLIPVALAGFLTPFFLLRKFVSDVYIRFICALFYGSSTYFLTRQTMHLPIAFVYAVAPLIFLAFIDAFDRNDRIGWMTFAVLSSIGLCYEVRIMLILWCIFGLYVLMIRARHLKRHLSGLVFAGILIAGLNAFWILPTFFGGFSEYIEDVANRGLFGSEFFDTAYALAFFDSGWSEAGPIYFTRQPIPPHYWIVPLLAFSAFLFKAVRRRRGLIFFGTLSLLGIFLTKQMAMPFHGMYLWLYQHVPGFNLFREASKFNLITAIGYTGLLAYSLLFLKERVGTFLGKASFAVSSVGLILLSVFSLKPLFTTEISSLFVSKSIPSEYATWTDFIVSQPDFSRVLWIPSNSSWSVSTSTHPRSNGYVIARHYFAAMQENLNEYGLSRHDQIMVPFESSFGNAFLDALSIRYVVISEDSKSDDKSSKVVRDYESRLDDIPYLKKISAGSSSLVTYENMDSRPHLYVTEDRETFKKNVPYEQVDVQAVNPARYAVRVNYIDAPIYLNFSERFDARWKIRIGDFAWYEAFDKSYFLPDFFHEKNELGLNSFRIEPSYVRTKLPESSFVEEADGSISMDLTVYYQPLSLFYAGLIISSITLLGCMMFAVFVSLGLVRRERAVLTVQDDER